MSNMQEKKKIKRDSLFNTAYELFTTKGLQKTAISDIVEKAGVAKGTFYLYFSDKYDLRNKLISHKASDLFTSANQDLEKTTLTGVEAQLIFVTNHIIDALAANPSLLTFISKNLVWGIFKTALHVSDGDTGLNFYDAYLRLLQKDDYRYEKPEVMLFTIIELTGSTCYNSILYEEPLPIEKYKPYLFRTIHSIIDSHKINN
ncbi:MAG: TetR/AcrR family transcriptional regulator [Lachnospiraceae bacterium]